MFLFDDHLIYAALLPSVTIKVLFTLCDTQIQKLSFPSAIIGYRCMARALFIRSIYTESRYCFLVSFC